MDESQRDTDNGFWAYVAEHPEEFMTLLSLPV